MNSLAEEMTLEILTYLDVRTLVEIKLVSRQWKRLSTTAIDAKGRNGTTRRKAFETNEELKIAVRKYCPLPKGDGITIPYGEIGTTITQQYCNREIAEEIACTYGWPINKWDVSKIEDFSFIFYSRKYFETGKLLYGDGLVSFNEPIQDWDTSKAATMRCMFASARLFNQDLSSWDVSNVTNMTHMFSYTRMFDQDLSSWDVSNVTDMTDMFEGAETFDQDLSSWDVSNVTNMTRMFSRTGMFDQDLSSWDVSNVTGMAYMFSNARMFNQDLSEWNVSNVIDMTGIFSEARMFNQDLSSWEGWRFRYYIMIEVSVV